MPQGERLARGFFMQIAVLFGVYEAEKDFAAQTLGSLLEVLRGHEIFVQIIDDGSPSELGAQLKARFAPLPNVALDVIRLPRPLGYYATQTRSQLGLKAIADRRVPFDFVLRVDADLFINRRDVGRLFEPGRLPAQGMTGMKLPYRLRDFLQLFLDILPFGFRRRKTAEGYIHAWEFKRTGSVWWWDIGLRALLHGFRREIFGGSFQVFCKETFAELARRGWFERDPHSQMGLVIGDDVINCLMVKALGHPFIDPSQVLPDWRYEIFVRPELGTWQEIAQQDHYLIHPLKADAWGRELRKNLSAKNKIHE